MTVETFFGENWQDISPEIDGTKTRGESYGKAIEAQAEDTECPRAIHLRDVDRIHFKDLAFIAR